MPRRREVPKRPFLADSVYNSKLVTRFINKIIQQGKKSSAERIFYEAMTLIQERTGEDPMKIFKAGSG